jgi:fatty acid desaturase
MAWYQLPKVYGAQRARLLAENGGYFYKGYREVVRRFLLKAKEPVVHPLSS